VKYFTKDNVIGNFSFDVKEREKEKGNTCIVGGKLILMQKEIHVGVFQVRNENRFALNIKSIKHT
jgi:hypothetical protein